MRVRKLQSNGVTFFTTGQGFPPQIFTYVIDPSAVTPEQQRDELIYRLTAACHTVAQQFQKGGFVDGVTIALLEEALQKFDDNEWEDLPDPLDPNWD